MNFAVFSDGFSSILKKSRLMTYLFFSCFVKEILLSSLFKKIREILGTEFLGGTKK